MNIGLVRTVFQLLNFELINAGVFAVLRFLTVLQTSSGSLALRSVNHTLYVSSSPSQPQNHSHSIIFAHPVSLQTYQFHSHHPITIFTL